MLNLNVLLYLRLVEHIQSYAELDGVLYCKIFLKNLFLWATLSLYNEFQCPPILETGQQVCGGGGGIVVSKPILVFSFAKAEQNVGHL